MLFKMAESVFFIFVVEPSDVKGTVSWPRRITKKAIMRELLYWKNEAGSSESSSWNCEEKWSDDLILVGGTTPV